MTERPAKPQGWWTTHPTMLSGCVHGTSEGTGDGLGDFEGIRRKLDFYLAAGISGFRLQHVGAYGDDYKWSGLVQQDWFDVDPHYGTMEDFRRLMADCREKDVRIILMAVPEYVGWHHPDYRAARQARDKGIEDPRVRWFEWKDDGGVLTCWDRPGCDVSSPGYMEAFLKHIGFWMDEGISGWDVDAVGTWHHLNLEALRKLTAYVVGRGGLVTAENMVLLHDITKQGGFNAGTGYLRHEFYSELKAMTEHRADYIREALKVRRDLIDLGMFPYQQFGDQSYSLLTSHWWCHIHEMFKLQIAFNAVLPDQVWILGNALTFSDTTRKLEGARYHYGGIDWTGIREQEKNPDSIFSCVRRMFRLRAQHKELAIGDIEEVPTNCGQDVFAAIRTSEDLEARALVVFSFSESYRDVVVNLAGREPAGLVNYLSGERLACWNGSVRLPLHPYGFKLLRMEGRVRSGSGTVDMAASSAPIISPASGKGPTT